MRGKSYGTVSPEQQKAMSGLEFVKGLASGALPLNTMARTEPAVRFDRSSPLAETAR